MSDAGGTEETTDYSKMKVTDLKKLLKSRGLPFAGVKTELIERLQSSETEAPSEDLLDGSEVGDDLVEDEELERELDESTLLIGDEIEKSDAKEETPKVSKEEGAEEKVSNSPVKSAPVVESAPPKQAEENAKVPPSSDSKQVEVPNTTQPPKRKISLKTENGTANDAIAKKKLRAERFGAEAGEKKEDILAKRAERFAANSTTKSTTSQDKDKVSSSDLLKKRAERFGILSPAEQKKQQLEKLQARKLRFSSTSSPATTTATATIAAVPALPEGVKPTQLSIEERKKLRAQRFSVNK